MNSLPTPPVRSSWISALILTTILFLVYYLYFYNFVFLKYDQQFYQRAYLLDKLNTDASLKTLDINARIPRYVDKAERIWTYVSVKNEGDQPILDVDLYLSITPVSSSSSSSILLPSLNGQDDKYVAEVFLGNIAPHSTVIGRIPLIVQMDTQVGDSIWILRSIIDKDVKTPLQQPVEWKQTGVTPILRINPSQALLHSFIEIILLPPWSNGTIFILAMLASYLGQDKTGGKRTASRESGSTISNDLSDEGKPDIFTFEMIRGVVTNLWKSSIILVIMIIFVSGMIIYGVIGLITFPVISALILILIILIARLVIKYIPVVGRIIKKMRMWMSGQIRNLQENILRIWRFPALVNYGFVILGIALLILDCVIILLPDTTPYLGPWVIRAPLIIILAILGLVYGWLGIFHVSKEKTKQDPPQQKDDVANKVDTTRNKKTAIQKEKPPKEKKGDLGNRGKPKEKIKQTVVKRNRDTDISTASSTLETNDPKLLASGGSSSTDLGDERIDSVKPVEPDSSTNPPDQT